MESTGGNSIAVDAVMTFSLENRPLQMFTAPHLVAVAVIFVICVSLVLAKDTLLDSEREKRFRMVMAVVISVQEILLFVWYTWSGEWSVSRTLPIQLCDVSIFLAVAVLITKNRYIAEVLYFWGFGGATQAILTPDMGPHTFPHFVFYQFFLGHGLIVLTCIFITFDRNFRITLKSVLRAFIITTIYGAIIIPINAITGGNYLFLRYKPQGGTIMDFLGPWPWYLLSLEVVVIILFLLLYLPYAILPSAARKK